MQEEIEHQSQPIAAVEDVSIEDFKAKVLDQSASQPILVDFWAPWCEPCKQLAPILEKVVSATDGRVKLVKMNIDEHPQIAGQLGIKSIPAVIAFQKGQPADGFMGVVPESQIKDFIERLIGPISDPIQDLIAVGNEALESGDSSSAIQKFEMALELDGSNFDALAGLARANIAIDNLDNAAILLDRIPEPKPQVPSVLEALAALNVAKQAEDISDLTLLEKAVDDDPNSHQARMDLAIGLATADRREEAADHLLQIIKTNRDWNDGAAKSQLLEFFQIWGPMDDQTIAARRKLSAILFS